MKNNTKIDFIDSLVENNSIAVGVNAIDWKDAIYKVFSPLKKSNAITEEYPNNVIQKTCELGPYYIIAPKLAMPHSRPEDGALKNSFSLITLSKPVKFDEKNEISLLIGFAAIDAETHLTVALPQIVAIFENQEIIDKIITAKNKNEILKIIKQINYMKYIK